ncbi:hypothetical protein AALF15_01375 [Corynebacteriaceae bacterium 7-707]
MAFRIEPTNRPEDFVDFEIVTNDGSTHEVSIPKNDCLPPETVDRLAETLASIEDTDMAAQVNRAQLKVIAPGNDDVFDQLTERQLNDILKHYRAESDGDLGESEASTD